MSPPSASVPTNQPLRYLYDSWVKTCGVGWTPAQVWLGYAFSVLAAVGVVGAASYRDLHWSPAQMVVAGLLAWDLFGGAVGYNHPARQSRRHQADEPRLLWQHNLQHIHPLIVMFFADTSVLVAVAAYWFVTFLLYVELLEADPRTSTRRWGDSAQRRVLGFEMVVVLALVVLAGSTAAVDNGSRVYGMVVFGGMVLFTAAVACSPAVFQRTAGVMAMLAMVVIGLYLSPPAGFEWLVPVYFVKLLVGYTPAPAPAPVVGET